jgi:hypothetical protein
MKDRAALTDAYEARATKSGVIPTGIDESNLIMNNLNHAANSLHRLNRDFDNKHVNPQPLRSTSKIFQNNTKEDPLLMEVLRMRMSAPRIPLPTREDLNRDVGPTKKNYYNSNGLLDSTRGSRLANNVSNRALYLNSSQATDTNKANVNSSGVAWLDDYRAMVRELDDMEFSTSRTLGFVQSKVYSQPYADYRKPVNLYSSTIPACGGIGGVSDSLLSRKQPDVILSHMDRQYSSSTDASSYSPYDRPILSPGVSVPMLYNLNTSEFVGTPINPYVPY